MLFSITAFIIYAFVFPCMPSVVFHKFYIFFIIIHFKMFSNLLIVSYFDAVFNPWAI